MSKKAVPTLVTPTLLYLNGIIQTRIPLLHISEMSINFSRNQVAKSAGLRSFLRNTLPLLRYHNSHVKFNVSIEQSARRSDSNPFTGVGISPAAAAAATTLSSKKVSSLSTISLSSSSPSSSSTVLDCRSLTDLEILHRILCFDGQRLNDTSLSFTQLKTTDEQKEYTNMLEENTRRRLKEVEMLNALAKESRNSAGLKMVEGYHGPPKQLKKRTLAIRKAYQMRKAKREEDAAKTTPSSDAATTEKVGKKETEKKDKSKEEQK